MSAAEEILARAEDEGIAIGVWGGLLTYRGASASLVGMLKFHEAEIVEALGGEYRSPLSDPWAPPPPPVTRTVGRITTTTERISYDRATAHHRGRTHPARVFEQGGQDNRNLSRRARPPER